jgi:hypothetical protein
MLVTGRVKKLKSFIGSRANPLAKGQPHLSDGPCSHVPSQHLYEHGARPPVPPKTRAAFPPPRGAPRSRSLAEAARARDRARDGVGTVLHRRLCAAAGEMTDGHHFNNISLGGRGGGVSPPSVSSPSVSVSSHRASRRVGSVVSLGFPAWNRLILWRPFRELALLSNLAYGVLFGA